MVADLYKRIAAEQGMVKSFEESQRRMLWSGSYSVSWYYIYHYYIKYSGLPGIISGILFSMRDYPFYWVTSRVGRSALNVLDGKTSRPKYGIGILG